MREIETKRLLLRKLRKDDAESIFRNWASDSEVAKYVTCDFTQMRICRMLIIMVLFINTALFFY